MNGRCTFSIAKRSTLSVKEKTIGRRFNRGIQCDSYSAKIHYRVRKDLKVRLSIPFVSDTWQTAFSFELKEQEYWKLRFSLCRVDGVDSLLLKRIPRGKLSLWARAQPFSGRELHGPFHKPLDQ